MEQWVRTGTADDAAACVAVYTPYVLETAISFETEVPTRAEMAGRITAALDTHDWLVLEPDDGAKPGMRVR